MSGAAAPPSSAAAGSALYVGQVTHRRHRPRAHSLRYRVFWLLLDLDEIDAVARRLRLFSRNRFNVFSIRDADYGDGGAEPLRHQIERHLAASGIALGGGAIRLFTMPRLLGYAFNPLSVYFCHRRDGALAAILYEVHNTFGQRHSYLIPVEDPAARPIRQRSAKRFYVSPFMDMGLDYDFTVVPPGDAVAVAIAAGDAEGPVLAAALRAERRPLTDAALLRAFLAIPLLTFKVSAAIRWEALFVWLKRAGLRPRPPPPDEALTIVAAREEPAEAA